MKQHYIKRYIIFFMGLLLNSYGVAFVTKAALGTSPIAAIPYSLSLIISKLSLGNWTIIFSLILIIMQFIILRSDASGIELILQAVISFFFGYFIDISMMCLNGFHPQLYGIKLLSLLTGCLIIAFGAYLEVTADVVMLPGDGFVRAIAKAVHKEYGSIRFFSDISMTFIAGMICLIFLHKLSGVREGTIIAALITGNIVKLFVKYLQPFTYYLRSELEMNSEDDSFSSKNFVLTISREYGSGGRQIGKIIADKLGIAYYDSELIHLAAKKSGFNEKIIEEKEQKLSHPVLHDFYTWYTSALNEEDMPDIEKIFHAEERVIKEIIKDGSCIIVGRLANFILKDYDNSLHVFICADMETKINRVMERDHLTKNEAAKQIKKVEKERENHCQYFFHSKWGNCNNYDISLKSDKYGIQNTAKILISLTENIDAYKNKQKQHLPQ